MEKRLYKNKEKKMLTGVCAGIADYLAIDPTIVRLIWALIALSGAGVVAYIACALIIPDKPQDIVDV